MFNRTYSAVVYPEFFSGGSVPEGRKLSLKVHGFMDG